MSCNLPIIFAKFNCVVICQLYLQAGGVNCGVVEWIERPWPVIVKKCLVKLWEMFHEQNIGRVIDKGAYDREIAKL